MDFINSLQEAAFASRLRRLSDHLIQDVGQIYAAQNWAFEPRWFPLLTALAHQPHQAIMELAQVLNVSHTAVKQLADEMMKAGLVDSQIDSNDKRRRILALSDQGQSLFEALKPLVDEIRQAVRDSLMATGADVLGVIESLETEFAKNPVAPRVLSRLNQKFLDEVSIGPYQPQHQRAFEALNRAWLEHYFTVEPQDVVSLGDPETHILSKGGHILCAVLNNQVVGVCALLYESDTQYELAKMAVDERFQGKQIGKKLATEALQKAKTLGATHVVLETNSALLAALSLYRKLGFKMVPLENPHYQRADTRMVLDLRESPRRAPLLG